VPIALLKENSLLYYADESFIHGFSEIVFLQVIVR